MKKYEFQIRLDIYGQEPLFKYVNGIRPAYKELTNDIEHNVRFSSIFNVSISEYRTPTIAEITDVAHNRSTYTYNIVLHSGIVQAKFTISLFNK